MVTAKASRIDTVGPNSIIPPKIRFEKNREIDYILNDTYVYNIQFDKF